MAIAINEESISVGPWVLGMDNVSKSTEVPPTALVAAQNVDIDRRGVATTRSLWATSAAGYYDVFEHSNNTYGVKAGSVDRIQNTGSGFAATQITTIGGDVFWCDVDGQLVYTDYVTIGFLNEDNTTSPLPQGYFAQDEEMEYQMAPMPGGRNLCYWRGRLLVTRGTTLVWSEPLRYGVYSAARNFLSFGTRINWVCPVSQGVYVGLADKVLFLSGTDPQEFTIKTVSGVSAPNASAILDSKHAGSGGEDLALWFTSVGFAIGAPDGTVLYPQADRLRDLPLPKGRLVVEDDRVYIFTTHYG